MTVDNDLIHWNFDKISTLDDLMQMVLQIAKNDEAIFLGYPARFIEEYAKIVTISSNYVDGIDVAMSNIGWVTGYMSEDDATLVKRVFRVGHPIFGDRSPTPEEAFKQGIGWAARLKSLHNKLSSPLE